MNDRSPTGRHAPKGKNTLDETPMAANRWRLLKRLYIAVKDLTPTERNDYLEHHCLGDNTLRAEVEALTRGDRADMEKVSIQSAIGQVASDLFSTDTVEGDAIGAYRIVKELGRGGMGSVWHATRSDDEYQSDVAIKVMHGLSGEQVRDRFLTERQMLANLNHPNISRLLDGGTTPSGAPYVVMEYVEGVPIDVYCEKNSLSLTDRIALFCLVCDAVQYAHRNLIVHRDIKPENILVTEERVPKLLDFGIAKIVSRELSDSSAHTLHGHSMLTPKFASPEQVLGQSVTTTSDIYSLGVLLNVLLTDSLPYTLESEDLFEVATAICEKEPIRPSTLNPDLRGDLDNILLKALHKDPELRYASADDFSEDLMRHLNRMPVHARPSTNLYRLSRFISRHSTAVALSALAVGGLLFATVFSWHQMQQAIKAQDTAEYERSVAINEILRTTLLSAKEAIESDDVASARRLLDRVQVRDRGWEWSVLASDLDESLANIRDPNTIAAGLWSDASPITIAKDGRISWWHGEQLIDQAHLPGAALSHAAVSRGGRFCVVARGENLLQLWSIDAPGNVQKVFEGTFDRPPIDLALSPDGIHIALVTQNELLLWNTAISTPTRWPVKHVPSTLSMSTDGSQIGIVFQRDQAEAYRIYSADGQTTSRADAFDLFSLALSSNGMRSATSESGNTIRLRETASTRVLDRYLGHRQPAQAVLFSDDGRWLVSGSPDGTLRFFATDDSDSSTTLNGLDADILSLHTDKNGRYATALLAHGGVKMWDARNPTNENNLAGQWARVHPNSEELYTLNSFGLLSRYDSVTLRQFDQKSIGALAASSFAMSKDGTMLAIGEHGNIVILDATTLTDKRHIELAAFNVIALAFSFDGSQIAALQTNGTLSVAELGSDAVRRVHQYAPLETGALVYSPISAQFVSAAHSRIDLWNSNSLDAIDHFDRTEASVLSLAYSHSGHQLVSGWSDGAVRLASSDSIDQQVELSERIGSVTAVAFSPDDTRIASGSSDSELWIWNTATKRPLLNINSSRSAGVDTLAFSPDGRQLVASFLDGRVRSWSNHTTKERWVATNRLEAVQQLHEQKVAALFEQTRIADRVATQIRRDASLRPQEKRAALELVLTPTTISAPLDRDPYDGHALKFDGGDEHVIAANPDLLAMQKDFTIETWVKPFPFAEDNTPLSFRMLINKEGEYQIAIRPDGSLHWTLASDKGWIGWVPTQYRLEHYRWSHIALVRDQRTVRFYLNGALIQEQTVPATIGDEHRFKNEFRIGGRQHTPSSFYGLIDEVRVWRSARTSSQLQDTMRASIAPDEPDLVAAWSFNEGDGLSTREVRNQHNGAVVGARWVKTSR